MNHSIKTLHLWVPNIFEFKGGVQVYSGFLLKALQELQPYQQLEVFLKHDKAVPKNLLGSHSAHFHAVGQWPMQLRTFAFASQLVFSAIKQKPDLIISTHLNFSPVAQWLKQLLGVPYWVVAHGVDAWDIEKPSLQNALRHADKILAVSHYTRDRLLAEQDLSPEQVLVLPNTFDANQFHINSKPKHLLDRYYLSSDQPVILTVARLDASERYKGYDSILQALPIVLKEVPDVRYILVGKGSDRPRIEQKIRELELDNIVILAGFVPDDEMQDYYNLCDVFAMPSKGEGFGIVYLEALACGKPVIGGNQDGAIDALCQGDLGLLVNPDNVDAIAQTLIQVLLHRSKHPILYSPAILRQQVKDIYGFEHFKQQLADLFDHYLAENYPA